MHSYKVADVQYDGTISMKSLRISDILRSSSIYARDLIALSLTSKHERTRRRYASLRLPQSVILPRGKEILVSFGNTRALIGPTGVTIFDAHSLSVKQFANQVAASFKDHVREVEVAKARGDKAARDLNYIAQPPELVFLEDVLRETCDAFDRRVRIYEPIVDSFVDKVANEVFSDAGVHQLVPIKDSLQSFEIHVKQSLECLTTLLNNDDDMLRLLLTEQRQAESRGETVSPERHEDVELLLEEYARQLNNILFEIHYLLQRLQSKQEFASLALAGYRNRLIRMNLYLALIGLSLGVGTTVAGFFGMNLISGFEESPTAFNTVILLTSATGASVAGVCASYVSGKTMRHRANERLEEIDTLTGALSDMSALDFTVKAMLEKRTPMSKDDFRMRLKQARATRNVTEKEVDLLFDAMDVQKDGVLFRDDFKGIKIHSNNNSNNDAATTKT
jgi:magnesium transporter